MLADELDYVLGVDPHRDRHALALVEVASGALVAEAALAASEVGYRQALEWAEAQAPGRRAWAIEGTGSYGAGLTRFLQQQGERVLEVGRLRRERTPRGKSDALDALRAARAVLGSPRAGNPRRGERRDGLRSLLVAREGAVAAKKAALCQLRALIVTCPEPLRSELARLSRARLLARCARLRIGSGADHGCRIALRTVARRAQALSDEERALKHDIEAYVRTLAPPLLAERGVGPISAARVLLAWSHPGRIHSEAAFARLAGSAPLDASSGQTIRRRLDRGGDRPTQPRPAHDHHQPTQERPRNDRLHPTPPTRRKKQPRSNPLPQALPRPPPLPTPRKPTAANDLTSIEASRFGAATCPPPSPRTPRPPGSARR
jgi:transposase